ncbi:hypothetical protein DB88DRAFT_442679 [Papiliotrema laurentii]|uniref:Transcription activator of gluconeogenesis ERT1 n=1 Tax=Papiliotrema laurentii TaxID=5418 RepID=A0AAD9CVX1_PAPLA|nr:hypothetical protein DB88DRAFT_442679 [Papiliotrema laurentii]
MSGVAAVSADLADAGVKRNGGSRNGKPRKKVAKACLTCQKSHLTCDEQRPCTRCMKKGIGDQCVEGVRKKAKYLLEGDERGECRSTAPSEPTSATNPTQPLAPHLSPHLASQQPLQALQSQTLSHPNDNDPFGLNSLNTNANGNDTFASQWANDFGSGGTGNNANTNNLASNLSSFPGNGTGATGGNGGFDLNSAWTSWTGANSNVGVTNGMSNPPSNAPTASGRSNRATPSEVYRTVVKPYDYTEGYHILMQYLTTNFEQRDILRVVHSLAAYRPSLIALQMPMSEEDEVFIERSFQRTLIELEKLISYSATPTAVWRRTGEVCYANPEFCRLVGQNEADLCGKKSYIYHLFAKPSVIAYWENFSNHAFENTTQNFFQPTMLKAGGGGDDKASNTVQCSACYTIRRDVFDLPSVIIGQFLPIPSDVA